MTNGLTAAIAVLDDYLDSQATDQERLVVAKCRALMHGYDARWKNDPWKTVSVEEQFHLPIVNPESGRESRTYTQAGKFDGVVCGNDGQHVLLEHKTTSEAIESQDAPYWKRLTIDAQVSSYMLANWQMGRKLAGTLYDVIRKPTIRPKKLEKNTRARIAAFKDYAGHVVPDVIVQRVVDGQETECPALYEMRLRQDCLERPGVYYGRRMIQRLDHELLEWAGMQWQVAQDVRQAELENRHYRNPNACMNYGTPCEFLGICSGYTSVDDESWQRVKAVHSELNNEVGDGRDVLTHSRVTTFLTCRQKHHLRYGLGLRRVDEDEREALYFGTCLHAALAAYWQCQVGSADVGQNACRSSLQTSEEACLP